MGACGCGDNTPKEVYKLGQGKYLGVAPYMGCDYCGTGIAYDLRFYDSRGRREWADGIPAEPMQFTEFGEQDASLMLGCCGKEDLLEAAKSLIKQLRMPKNFRHYRTVEEWLEDYGLELLQEAFRQHLREVDEIRAEIKVHQAAALEAPCKD